MTTATGDSLASMWMTSVSLQVLKPLHESPEEGGFEAHHYRSPGVSHAQLGVWRLASRSIAKGSETFWMCFRLLLGPYLIQGGSKESISPKGGSSVGKRGSEAGQLASGPSSAIISPSASLCLPTSCHMQGKPDHCSGAPSSLQTSLLTLVPTSRNHSILLLLTV